MGYFPSDYDYLWFDNGHRCADTSDVWWVYKVLGDGEEEISEIVIRN